MDLGDATVFRAIEKLLLKELIIKDAKTGWLKSSDAWNEQMANSHDWTVGFKGSETQYISGKVNSDRDSIKSEADSIKMIEGDSIKMIDNSKINNNNNNNNNIKASTKLEQAPNAKREFGNLEINEMLIALKNRIGISAFVDSRIERNIAKHCVGLLQRIGKDEFVRRLDIILEDTFHHKNCNKILYVYNQIKGFIEPKIKSRVGVIS